MGTQCTYWVMSCQDTHGVINTYYFCACDDDPEVYGASCNDTNGPPCPPSVQAFLASHNGNLSGTGECFNGLSGLSASRSNNADAAAAGYPPCEASPRWWCIQCQGENTPCFYYCGTYDGVGRFFGYQNGTGQIFPPEDCPTGYIIREATPNEIGLANLGPCSVLPDPSSVIRYCNGRLSLKVGSKLCRCGHYTPSGPPHFPPEPSIGAFESGILSSCGNCNGVVVAKVPQYVDLTLPAIAKGDAWYLCSGQKYCGFNYTGAIDVNFVAEADCAGLAGTYRLWWGGLFVANPIQQSGIGCCYYYDFPGHNSFGTINFPQRDPTGSTICYDPGSTFWKNINLCMGGIGRNTLFTAVAGGNSCYQDGFGCIGAGSGTGWALFRPDALVPERVTWPNVDVNCEGATYPLYSTGTSQCCRNGDGGDITAFSPENFGTGAPASVTIGPAF